MITSTTRQEKSSLYIESFEYGGTMLLDYEGSDTIRDVKIKISKYRGICSDTVTLYLPDQQRLTFHDSQLDDEKTLSAYGIDSESRLHLFLRRTLLIKTLADKIIVLNLWPTDRIQSVKEAIYVKEGIPPDQQRLIFHGRQLDDKRMFSDYKIADCVIQLVPPFGSDSQTGKKAPKDPQLGSSNHRQIGRYSLTISTPDPVGPCLFIQAWNKTAIPLDFKETDTTTDLKLKIYNKVKIYNMKSGENEGVPPRYQKLIFAGHRLEDKKPLADYRISANSTISWWISERWRFGLHLFIKTMTGKCITLEVPDEETVKDAKLRIQDKEGIPVDQQRLIFNKRELDDEWFFSDYNVNSASPIHLVLRLSKVDSQTGKETTPSSQTDSSKCMPKNSPSQALFTNPTPPVTAAGKGSVDVSQLSSKNFRQVTAGLDTTYDMIEASNINSLGEDIKNKFIAGKLDDGILLMDKLLTIGEMAILRILFQKKASIDPLPIVDALSTALGSSYLINRPKIQVDLMHLVRILSEIACVIYPDSSLLLDKTLYKTIMTACSKVTKNAQKFTEKAEEKDDPELSQIAASLDLETECAIDALKTLNDPSVTNYLLQIGKLAWDKDVKKLIDLVGELWAQKSKDVVGDIREMCWLARLFKDYGEEMVGSAIEPRFQLMLKDFQTRIDGAKGDLCRKGYAQILAELSCSSYDPLYQLVENLKTYAQSTEEWTAYHVRAFVIPLLGRLYQYYEKMQQKTKRDDLYEFVTALSGTEQHRKVIPILNKTKAKMQLPAPS